MSYIYFQYISARKRREAHRSWIVHIVKQAIYNARKEHCQQISSANPRLPGDTALIPKVKYEEPVGDLLFCLTFKEDPGHFRFTPKIAPAYCSTPEVVFSMKLLMEGMRSLDKENQKKNALLQLT